MRRLKHIPFVFACGLLTLAGAPFVTPFAGMGTPDLVMGILAGVAASHLAGLLVGFAFERVSKISAVVVCAICLVPLGFLSVLHVKDAIHLNYYAPSERFRDNLADPIPRSVSNIRFVPLKECYEPNLILRFSISPEDLEKVIHDKGFLRIDAEGFRRPDDLFTHEEYLPMEGRPSFYLATDRFGEVHTLKVSEDRRSVIYRRESSAYYRYRYWETHPELEAKWLDELKKRS